MRVLMSADTIGGVWTYAVELARALPDFDFTIATMGALPTDVQRASLPRNAVIVPSADKLEWQPDPWDDVARAGDWLLSLEAQTNADVVHLNGYAHGALPFQAPKLVVGHSCVLSWWRAVKNEEAPAEWSRYHDAVERGLRGADLVASPSAAMLDALHRHYDFETPSRVVHNGARAAAATHVDEASRTRIFTAGRLWDEAKNIAAVLAAAPRLHWPVRIAGDGEASAVNVTHLGRLTPAVMAEELAHAGIYLFPALYEPFGLSILEAALAGCALVIGEIDSLRELWDGAALFVPPRDVDAIVETVNTLSSDSAARQELGRRARERATRYSVERMADGYRDLYAVLTGNVASTSMWEARA